MDYSFSEYGSVSSVRAPNAEPLRYYDGDVAVQMAREFYESVTRVLPMRCHFRGCENGRCISILSISPRGASTVSGTSFNQHLPCSWSS